MESNTQQHMGQLFAQNWSLFAPDPLHSNSILYASCLMDGGGESGWYDMTSGTIQAFHNQPLGAYTRLARMHLVAIRQYQGVTDPTTELVRQKLCAVDAENAACTRDDAQSRSVQSVGKKMLARLGSSACMKIAKDSGEKVSKVKMRVIELPVRPYSERSNKEWVPEVTGFETEWFPFEQVAPLSNIILIPEANAT